MFFTLFNIYTQFISGKKKHKSKYEWVHLYFDFCPNANVVVLGFFSFSLKCCGTSIKKIVWLFYCLEFNY